MPRTPKKPRTPCFQPHFHESPQRTTQLEHDVVAVGGAACAGLGRDQSYNERPSFDGLLALLADVHAELQSENRTLWHEVGQIRAEADGGPDAKQDKQSDSPFAKTHPSPPINLPLSPPLADMPSFHASTTSRSVISEATSPLSSPAASPLMSHKKKMLGIQEKFRRLEAESKQRLRSVAVELDCVLFLHNGKSWPLGRVGRTSRHGEVGAGDVAKALNEARGAEDLGPRLTYDTFVDLMTLTDYERFFDVAISEKITEIRKMYAQDDMTRMVARFSNVEAADMRHKKRTSSCSRKFLDPISLCVIILNALILAVAADADSGWEGWDFLEFGFTSFFISELALKLYMYGFSDYFTGSDWLWNSADVIFVCFAVMDTVLVMVQMSGSNLQLFTVIRLVRLTRITRVIRVLRFKVFKELLLMVRGIIAGLRTLFWAIILLLFVIFVLGIFMRQTIGHWCDPATEDPEVSSLCRNPHLVRNAPRLFSTVARSCFTVFRCFTEGCVSSDGTPLMIHLYDNGWYGSMMVILYMLCFLAVTFGLFNLIMAVFVENTMAAAKVSERKRHRMRDIEHVYVARKLQHLVLQFCNVSKQDERNRRPSQRLSRSELPIGHITRPSLFSRLFGSSKKEEENSLPQLESGFDVKITRNLFRQVVDDPQMEKLLDDLEVNVADHMSLFDILDADGSGSLDVPELIMGIMKLRGSADKGDVVATLLAVRAMQKDIRSIEGFVKRISRALDGSGSVAGGQAQTRPKL